MNVFDIAFATMFATAVGLLGAALIAWLSWTAFKLVHHPQWGPLAALVGIVAATYASLRTNEILQMLVLFGALAACVAWVTPTPSHED